jgi:hypothetical protein
MTRFAGWRSYDRELRPGPADVVNRGTAGIKGRRLQRNGSIIEGVETWKV